MEDYERLAIMADHERPMFFPTPAEFRRWLERNHNNVRELWLGFYKKSSGRPSITWPEAVDQLLCFGWIDGVRKSIDEKSYMIRVTPRRVRSSWSAVNLKRVRELKRLGLMHNAGLQVFSACDEGSVGRSSFERNNVRFNSAQEKQFRAKRRAWSFFQSQPPGYQRTAIWWVVSAKQESTRQKRLLVLIADSAAGLRVKPLRRTK